MLRSASGPANLAAKIEIRSVPRHEIAPAESLTGTRSDLSRPPLSGAAQRRRSSLRRQTASNAFALTCLPFIFPRNPSCGAAVIQLHFAEKTLPKPLRDVEFSEPPTGTHNAGGGWSSIGAPLLEPSPPTS